MGEGRVMKKKNRKSLKWKLISIMLLYWVLPFLVIIGTIGVYMFTSQEQNQMERLVSQVEMNNNMCVERLRMLIADSRQATYDKILYDNYRTYKYAQEGELAERVFYSAAQNYLDAQYSQKKNNSIAVLMLRSNPKERNYSSYNFSTGGSYSQIQTFFNNDIEEVLSVSEELDTSVGFVLCEDRLYLVRNMMDKNFRPWGILVNRVNVEYCFESLINFENDYNVSVALNGTPVIRSGGEGEWENMPELAFERKGNYQFHKDRVYTFQRVKNNDFNLELVLNAKKTDLFTPLYGYMYLVLVMVLFLIPMLLLFFWLSRKYLSRPVERMMDSAGQIESGNLGYQMEGDTGSLEFEYLREAMNHMSERLKYQFDHIYEEELALRDAKIMALQSHINPHFMNNTLEIINWEARLSGNEKVSKMISSLSTLMDAAIDRKKLPEVPLSEEMIYVNAYLYITSERLGKRLTIEKELPPEIMNLKVPRLIMQPIIENAIEHGVVPLGGGCVRICGRREGDNLCLDVFNDGDFTEEDEKRVARLLAPDYDTSKESSGNMGIANVNQRLRILYGESCGLTIRRCGELKTVSTLTILAHS